MIVRILNQTDYGIYAYTTNIISMFLLLDGLGTASAALQFASEKMNDLKKKNVYMKFGFEVGFLFDVFLALLILAISFIHNFKIENANFILVLMSLQPLTNYILTTIQVYLRSSIENVKYSIFNLIQIISFVTGTILGAYFYGIIGAIIGQYISNIITIIVGIIISKNYLNIFKEKNRLSKEEIKVFLEYSTVTAFNNGISSLLYTIDVFVIGIFYPDASIIALYKTATIIPFALNFIPTAVVTYIYPYFAYHNSDKVWIKKKSKILFKYFGLFNLCLSFVLFIFAPNIISVFFGNQYLDAIIPFRILSIGYFFAATFRVPSGNIIAILRKVKFNMYIAMCSGIMNIILNIPFIKYFGPVGASIATVFIYLFTSIANVLYLKKITK